MRKWQHIKLSYRESLFCQWGLFLHWNRFIVNTSQTLPLVKISDCEERDTFQRDIWYQNPLPYIKSNECLIEYFIWSVTVKQNKYLNSMQTVLPPQTWILLSEIDLEHFTLSVFMKQRIETKLLKSCFRDKNYASNLFFWKGLWILPVLK